MNLYEKHGEAFYRITGPLHYSGHKNKSGQTLVCPGNPIFGFKREGDLPGCNLDPVDVLCVLEDHLQDTPAAAHIAAAIKSFAASPNESPTGVSPGGGPPRRAHRKKPETAEVAA